MSSFKRKVKNPTADVSEATSNQDGPDSTASPSSSMVTVAPVSGVKPWIHTGLGMVSSGHRELDDMLHGGFAAGSIVTYYSDEYSNYSETLMAYSLAEGLSHGHKTLICGCEESQFESLLQNVPFNLSFDKIHAKDPSPAPETAKDTQDHGLKIAWQYEKYLVKNAGQNTNKLADARGLTYCCSYDLSRRLQPEIMDNGSLLLLPLDPTVLFAADAAKDAFQRTLQVILQSVITFLRQQFEENPRSMARIFLPQTHQLLAPYLLTSQVNPIELYRLWTQFLTALRRTIAEARVVVHLSMPSPSKTSLLPIDVYTACHVLTDVILEVESFAGHADTIPPEFRDFVAFFRIRHMHQRGLLASPPPKATKYGMKRDRRKLHIELLHLPPEESRAMQSSNSINCSSSSIGSTNSTGINANTMKMATLMGLTAAQQQQQSPQHPQQSASLGHSHDHQHGHSHGSGSTGGHIRLEVETEDSSAAFGSSNPPTSTTQGGRSSGLAAALASARAARSAAGQMSSSTETPTSSSTSSAPSTPSPSHAAASDTAVGDADDTTSASTFAVRPISINSANVRSGGVSSFLRKKQASSAPPSLDF